MFMVWLSAHALRCTFDGLGSPSGEGTMTSTRVDHSAEEIRQLHRAFRGLNEQKEWGTNNTVHPEDLPRVIEIFSHGITGEPYELEARVPRSLTSGQEQEKV